MKFILKPSLEHISLVKIAVTLWNQNDIRGLIAQLSFPPYIRWTDKIWKKLEERVTEKVPQLPLTQISKENVLYFIKLIGIEIITWINFHHRYLHVYLPVELFWTPQGTVDRKKTAEMFVKSENLDMSVRYKLACIYCFEKDIHEFWKIMPKDLKKSLLDDTALPRIVVIWSLYMKKKKRRRRNEHFSNKYKFEYCAEVEIEEAADYFLKKLTPNEREESLEKMANYVAEHHRTTRILFFLLSEMDEQQQMKVLRKNPYLFLKHFLHWPFHSFFIEVANRTWGFLDKWHYHHLLKLITNMHAQGYNDLNYPRLFREFWEESPNALKSFMTGGLGDVNLLLLLFHIEAKETMRLMFKDTTIAIQEKLTYNHNIHDYFEYSIRNNKWDLFEFFVQECLPSKTAVLKFKEIFEKRIMWDNVEDNLARNKQKWDKLFNVSDDSICKYDSAEET